jgi:hypothetical protein
MPETEGKPGQEEAAATAALILHFVVTRGIGLIIHGPTKWYARTVRPTVDIFKIQVTPTEIPRLTLEED